MSERTFVVIFFFWAVLTIITPTLVHLSETAKAQQLRQSNGGESSEGIIKARRMMMVYPEKHRIKTPKAQPINSTHTTVPAPSPAPAPAPAPAPDIEETLLDMVVSDSMQLLLNKTRLDVIT